MSAPTPRLAGLTALAAGRVPTVGLPQDLGLREVEEVVRAVESAGTAELGEHAVRTQLHVADIGSWDGGLEIHLRDDVVVAVLGADPFTAEGGAPTVDEEALAALGEPELVLDAPLGTLRLAGGERAWTGRGVMVRSNPDNGVLLGAATFAPCTAQQYLSELRPSAEPRRRLVGGGPAMVGET